MQKRFKTYSLAVAILIVYAVVSWLLVPITLASKNPLIAFGFPMLIGIIFGVGFLYIFSHDKEFAVAKIIEEREKKNQKKWMKHFAHSGKLITCSIIGILAGPLPAALAIRFLLNKAPYKYALVAFLNVPSTLLFMGGFKGIYSLFVR